MRILKSTIKMRFVFSLTCISLILTFASSIPAWIDDFNDGKADGWTAIQGDWEVKDGRYTQNDIPTPAAGTGTMECYNRSFVGDVNWSDYTVEVDLIIDEPGEAAPIAGIFVRVAEKSDEGQYYFFRIDTRPDWGPGVVEAPNNNFAGQNGGKMEGGLDPEFMALEENEVEYHLKVVAEGNHFLYYVDDDLVLDIVDDVDPILSGAVGVGTFNCGASFDNLEVTGEGVPGSVSIEDKLAICWGMLKVGVR